MSVELRRVPAGRYDVAVLVYSPRRARDVTVVVGHGYSSSKHNLDFLCGFLASHGYGIYSLDFPGHKLGATGGTLHGVDDVMASMRAVIAAARELAPSALYTLGHSMGAMTALLTAAADATIDGVVAIATGYGRPSAIDALKGKGNVDFRASYVEGIELPELVRDVDRRFDAALPHLAGRPQLYVAALRDAMVNVASVRELYERAPEPKTFVTIDSDHTYAGENARAEVLQWLNARHPR